MPTIDIVYYTEDGNTSILDWVDSLPDKAKDKCIALIQMLNVYGHELRRPQADFLDRKIHELRVVHNSIQYRMLYFFYGRKAVILTHGFIKEGSRVPVREIDKAVICKEKYEKNPSLHTYSN